jgi:hypothetical protein
MESGAVRRKGWETSSLDIYFINSKNKRPNIQKM